MAKLPPQYGAAAGATFLAMTPQAICRNTSLMPIGLMPPSSLPSATPRDVASSVRSSVHSSGMRPLAMNWMTRVSASLPAADMRPMFALTKSLVTRLRPAASFFLRE